MRRTLVAATLGLVTLVHVAAMSAPPARQSSPAAIRAADARLHIDRRVVIEDEVAQVANEPQSGVTYLNFGRPFPHHVFRAIVPDVVARQLPLATLTATFVRVTGIPTLAASGIPEILCADPTQVVALPSLSPSTATAAPAAIPSIAKPPTTPVRKCCRVCSTGKPCGDSCIARTLTCRQPPGCAC